jgi:hypothetical protein
MLEFSLQRKKILESAAEFIVTALGGKPQETGSHLVVNCDRLSLRKVHRTESIKVPNWIDDGMTTFSLRVFDSRNNKVGRIRISRHLTMTYGLSDELVIDINNLIYEKILYSPEETSASDIFSLLQSLGSYVLPAETNLYTQLIALRLATFGVLIGVLFSITGPIQNTIMDFDRPYSTALGFSLLYLGLLVLAAGLWWFVGKLVARLQ